MIDEQKVRELVVKLHRLADYAHNVDAGVDPNMLKGLLNELEAALAAGDAGPIEIKPTDLCAKVHCGHPASEHNMDGDCQHPKCFCGRFEIAQPAVAKRDSTAPASAAKDGK